MHKHQPQRGAALLIAVMMLSFLALVGGALVVGVTLDARIGMAYRKATDLLYLAESGIEKGRETLRTAAFTPSQLLTTAAGPDGVLSTAKDLETLQASDDVPLNRIDAGTNRRVVYLRNDAADGFSNLDDRNGVLTLVSIASSGPARKTIEVTIRRSRLPRLLAALTLDGTPATFTPSIASGFAIRGLDSSLTADHGHAVAVIGETDRTAAIMAIPSTGASQYPGSGVLAPPPPDIAVVEDDLDVRLKTPSGLERLAREIDSVAESHFRPAWNETTSIGNAGTAEDPLVIAVDGNCTVGPGTGYGTLLVRGVLTFTSNVEWNGAIVVIGQGTISTAGAGSVRISGGVLAARTRDSDRSAANPPGTLLDRRGSIATDFSGIGTGGIGLDRTAEAALNRKLPYVPIAIKEY